MQETCYTAVAQSLPPAMSCSCWIVWSWLPASCSTVTAIYTAIVPVPAAVPRPPAAVLQAYASCWAAMLLRLLSCSHILLLPILLLLTRR
jgi:hypothetical protein